MSNLRLGEFLRRGEEFGGWVIGGPPYYRVWEVRRGEGRCVTLHFVIKNPFKSLLVMLLRGCHRH